MLSGNARDAIHELDGQKQSAEESARRKNRVRGNAGPIFPGKWCMAIADSMNRNGAQRSASNMIKSLEGSRGAAALIVALYHLKIGGDYFSLIRNGYLFVDLFFVLSGFVICLSYSTELARVADFRSFLIRRIGRLLPLLIFSTFLFLLASNAIVLGKKLALENGYGNVLNTPQALEYLVPTAKELITTFTFTHSLGVFDHLILNPPTWSISTEFYTYFLFAAVCLLIPKRRFSIAFAGCSMIGFLVTIWASFKVHDCVAEGGCLALTYDFGLFRCMYSFFLGALTYYASKRFTFSPTWFQLFVFAGLAALLTAVDRIPEIAFAFPVCYALIVLSLSKDEGLFAWVLKSRIFQMLGQRSYSIYLVHIPLLLFFENLATRAHGVPAKGAVLILYLTAVVAVSGWTYRLVENPLRKVFNRLAASSSMAVTSAAP